MTVDVINSERLLVRSPRQSDLETLHDIVFSDPDVMAQAFAGKTFTRAQSTDFFARTFDHEGHGRHPGILVERNSGNVIGFAGLMRTTALGEKDYEIGFVLAQACWGKGYATEIGIAQIEYGFGVAGCERLLALALPENIASISVLLKIGMHYHSTITTAARGRRNVYQAGNSDQTMRTEQ